MPIQKLMSPSLVLGWVSAQLLLSPFWCDMKSFPILTCQESSVMVLIRVLFTTPKNTHKMAMKLASTDSPLIRLGTICAYFVSIGKKKLALKNVLKKKTQSEQYFLPCKYLQIDKWIDV